MAKRLTRQRIIRNKSDIAEGMTALSRQCEYMARAFDVTGMPPLRRGRAGFVGLGRIIVAQQLSVASAQSIWKRLEEALSPFNAGTLASVSDEILQDCGLSRPKIRTFRALGQALDDGAFSFAALGRLEAGEVHDRLTTVKGIGPWTADIYLMFCLGQADAFAPGDLALQKAAAELMGLAERPGAEAFEEIAERWRPWRGVAARALWAYYAHQRSGRSALPT